ncbi:hypothetical protein CL654_02905 [bacterium]|nr:hypothetical protein [bacterium]
MFAHKNLIIEEYKPDRARLRGILTELKKGAVFNHTVRIRFKYRITGRVPSRVLYYVRLITLLPLSYIPGIRGIVRWVDGLVNPGRANDEMFEHYKPRLVFSTASMGYEGILRGAKRHGIKTVDMPKSWDVLSKMLFGFKADHLLVWNPFMKKQAIKYQNYTSDEITVTGIPQFDFYSQKERLVSREAFCEKFGFDPNKKIILYGSTGGNCCKEDDYLELIHSHIEKGDLSNVQMLVRPHIGYKNDLKRFDSVGHYKEIVLDDTARLDDSFRDRWDVSEEYINTLFNSLYHADLCINIASTITLDALACDTPVININFDTKKVNPHFSTRRLFLSDYIEAIRKTEATRIVEKKEYFIDAINDILSNGQSESEKVGMQKITEHLMYKNDGRSAERIKDALIGLVE